MAFDVTVGSRDFYASLAKNTKVLKEIENPNVSKLCLTIKKALFIALKIFYFTIPWCNKQIQMCDEKLKQKIDAEEMRILNSQKKSLIDTLCHLHSFSFSDQGGVAVTKVNDGDRAVLDSNTSRVEQFTDNLIERGFSKKTQSKLLLLLTSSLGYAKNAYRNKGYTFKFVNYSFSLDSKSEQATITFNGRLKKTQRAASLEEYIDQSHSFEVPLRYITSDNIKGYR